MFVRPGSEWNERDVARSAREEVLSLGERGTRAIQTPVRTFKQTAEARPYSSSKTVFRSKNRVCVLIVLYFNLGARAHVRDHCHEYEKRLGLKVGALEALIVI